MRPASDRTVLFSSGNRCVVALMVAALVISGCSKPNKGTALDPEIIEAMNQGVGFMSQYDYEHAVAAFEKVVQAAPAFAEAKVNLAIALFNRARREDHDIDRAGQLLDAVLAGDPTNVRALYFKGVILQHTGNTLDAMAYFEKVTNLKPDDAVAWYLLGLCQQRLGKPAESALKRAVELRPNLYSAYYQLYQSALRAGDTNKAKEYMTQFMALRQNPLGESIELPQYNQMGDLALARPFASRPPPVSGSRYSVTSPQLVFEARGSIRFSGSDASAIGRGNVQLPLSSVAGGDFDLDGRVELVAVVSTPEHRGGLLLFKPNDKGGFDPVTTNSPFSNVRNAVSCAVGDFDNDGKPDLFVACDGRNVLLKGDGAGGFTDVTDSTGTGGPDVLSLSAVFVDADHDGDLDIFVCNASGVGKGSPAGNQLLNNNGDGTFRDIARESGLECTGSTTVLALFGDVDGDRDSDLLLMRARAPALLFLNELGGRFRQAQTQVEIRGELAGVMQDFNGDGNLDVLSAGGEKAELQLWLGDGKGHFSKSSGFEGIARTAATWGPVRAVRSVDVDLDGDLDAVVLGSECHILLNNGSGAFVWQARALPVPGNTMESVGVIDVNGDLAFDLVVGSRTGLQVYYGQLTPPATGLAVVPTGLRERDGRTRSPASGYGVKITVRAGLLEQTIVYTGQNGGPDQSLLPLAIGLGGHARADYVTLLWPDGVAQAELGLTGGSTHRISEVQRRISSCPVLFAWNGERFEFVTDFAGVGGLGYYIAPGQSATPQVLEHVKIEGGRLLPRGGFYELRITEPMEEVAFIDRLELVAIDHPQGTVVFPDERLTVGGVEPTHELIVVEKPVHPVEAIDYLGRDCTEQVGRADRWYAYAPPLDRRYHGFCQRHSLEVDFGDALKHFGEGARVFLFVRGYIEYPYSQTVYAAAQSGVRWEPIRVERLTPDNRWETIIPDAGVLGGIDRTMTIELTGLVGTEDRRFRLTTNLEIGYDEVFLGKHVGADRVRWRAIPMLSAELRRVGFAREYSPDGRLP
ncbi:MAG: FG-GAP-like repeat-containing protein, partial [Verrucomicrobiae bacterium]|nr:FG-GAP-like repeat-containing protein [Verrucomicrobiae bacterium]